MPGNSLNHGMSGPHATEVHRANRELIRWRARELALLSGRIPPELTQSDYDRAEQELFGESERDEKDERIDSLPESMRWDPVPDSQGGPAPGIGDDGLSDSERLAEEGALEAKRDSMLESEADKQV